MGEHLSNVGYGRQESLAAVRERARTRMSAALMPYSRARHFDRILQRRSVRTLYQPIVDLTSMETVAFEALARGPEGSPLEAPDALFRTARDLGLTRELDWVCRAKAMDGALQNGMRGSTTLFVNVEPDVAATIPPPDLAPTIRQAERDLRVVLEVTERALLRRPAELLHWLSWARERWWGVALDDVGAHPDSLALMPFVNPDVIKLDFRYVRKEVLDADDERVLTAVADQAARTGATILAEGIETPEQLLRARQLGATLGQGWFFGRPAALPEARSSPCRAVPLLDIQPPRAVTSPYELVEEDAGAPATLPEAHVRRLFARLEQRALLSREAPVVLGCFPPPPGPWGRPAERFTRLLGAAAFVGAVGIDVPAVIKDGFQTGPLDELETMSDEWVLAVIAPHHSEVAVAYDAGDRNEQGHRLLDVVSSTRRDIVAPVAELLMRKLVRGDPPNMRG